MPSNHNHHNYHDDSQVHSPCDMATGGSSKPMLFSLLQVKCYDGSIGDDEDDNDFNLIPVQAGRHQDALSPS